MIVETFFLVEEKRAMDTPFFQDLCRHRRRACQESRISRVLPFD
jgi:hypothetical protein